MKQRASLFKILTWGIIFVTGIVFGLFIEIFNTNSTGDTIGDYKLTDKYSDSLELRHIFFGLTSSHKTWPARRQYVRSWWKPNNTNVIVWMNTLPSKIDPNDPPLKTPERRGVIIDDKEYLNFARMSRIVIEAFRMDKKGRFRWFVMGDDDTFFSPNGVLAILSKYNHNEPMYIGSLSETHLQNVNFGHHMAFGGGGFAISRALAERLNFTMDECLIRNNEYWGLDERVASCVVETGVALTVENGFHQCDFMGSLEGLLEGHSLNVFATLHHLDLLDLPFPHIKDKIKSLTKLTESIDPDPVGFAQRSFCFDKLNDSWTMQIVWGYSVKFLRNARRFYELNGVERTFNGWIDRSSLPLEFPFNTRRPEKMANLSDTCALPFVMYVTEVKKGQNGEIKSVYERPKLFKKLNRSGCNQVPFQVEKVEVIRKRKMEVNLRKGLSSGPNLKRQCCKDYVFATSGIAKSPKVTVFLDDCSLDESVAPLWKNSKFRSGKPRLRKRKKYKKKLVKKQGSV